MAAPSSALHELAMLLTTETDRSVVGLQLLWLWQEAGD